MAKRLCAYCGTQNPSTVDHVVPNLLYAAPEREVTEQRITVDACKECNASWKDDEPHFRNMLLVSGEPNRTAKSIWEGKAKRSFRYVDGHRRVRELAERLVQVSEAEYKVFPANDHRVMRIIRKIIRGLCHHHHLMSQVNDEQVFADVQRFETPPAFLGEMTSTEAGSDVVRYRYMSPVDESIHSFWMLTFYERTFFIGIVYWSHEAREKVENEG